MSTDIIERLRLNAKEHPLDINQAVLDEAAGHIEQLRARVADLEARLSDRFASECAPLWFVENIDRERKVTAVDEAALKALRAAVKAFLSLPERSGLHAQSREELQAEERVIAAACRLIMSGERNRLGVAIQSGSVPEGGAA
ncbi:MAG: hypothetical protein II007_13470 [Gammaproteobacteria bacterium]|nr:hypothetical protein [Gammaproteobacteria bacterium]